MSTRNTILTHIGPHEALLLDELLSLIFKCLYCEPDGQRTLAAAARTCRAWYDPASDVLWDYVDMEDLLRLLAPLEQRQRMWVSL